MLHVIGPSNYTLHNVATAGYVPVVYKQQQEKQQQQNNQQQKQEQYKDQTKTKQQQEKQDEKQNKIGFSWVLTAQEIKSLIISALIFLSVFAWVDVLATLYRNRLLSNKSNNNSNNNLNNNLAGIYPPRFPHRIPESLMERTMDLELKDKISYSIILTGVSIISLIILSIKL